MYIEAKVVSSHGTLCGFMTCTQRQGLASQQGLSILSWNINGLSESKLDCFDTHQYLKRHPIIALTETRTSSPEILLENFTSFVKPATTSGCPREGIAMLLNNDLPFTAQIWTQACSPDTLWLKFDVGSLDLNMPVFVGVCYMPPSTSPRYQQTSLPDRLTALSSDVSRAALQGHVLIVGDLNAKFTFSPSPCAVNGLGTHILHLCQLCDLKLCTGTLPGDLDTPPSHTSFARNSTSRLDHVLCSSGYYASLASLHIDTDRRESDHWPLLLSLHCSALLMPPASTGSPLPRLLWNASKQEQYTAYIQDGPAIAKLQVCQELADSGQLDAAILEFSLLIQHAARATGHKYIRPHVRTHHRCSPRVPYFDDECLALKREWRRLAVAHAESHLVKQAERAYHCLVRKKKRAYQKSQNKQLIYDVAHRPQHFWSQLKPRPKPMPANLRDPAPWQHYVTNLCDPQPRPQPAPASLITSTPIASRTHDLYTSAAELNAPFPVSEIESQLARLHVNRSPAILGFPSEFLKGAWTMQQNPSGQFVRAYTLAPILTSMCNALLKSNRMPSALCTALLTPVFKRADPMLPANYRPIAVGEPVYRLFTAALNARLLAWTERQQVRAAAQAGFRPKKSTEHQLFTLRHAIDRSKASKQPIFASFVDLKGAYDLVQHKVLWKVLEILGIHGEMAAAIHALYDDAKLAIKVDGRMGDKVHPTIGVKQGCPLSPLLFGLFMDALEHYLAEHAPGAGVDLAVGFIVALLMYADDITLLATSEQDLQRLLDALHAFCGDMGMQISLEKTKIVVFNKKYWPTQNWGFQWQVDGNALPEVDQYKYLGLIYTEDGNMNKMLDALLQKGSFKIHQIWAELRQADVGEFAWLALHLFKARVEPAMLYGCEVWGPRLCLQSAGTYAKKFQDTVLRKN